MSTYTDTIKPYVIKNTIMINVLKLLLESGFTEVLEEIITWFSNNIMKIKENNNG